MSWRQYVYTLRYLRPVQIYGLARKRLVHSLPAGSSVVQGARLSEHIQPPRLPFLPTPKSLQGTSLTFLNHTVDYPLGVHWDDPALPKLWRYNLHYMPFLHQPGITATERRDWMRSWVRANPDPRGEGWEPFPTSVRLVNWCKVWWMDGLPDRDDLLLASAYAQARHLRRCVEYHLQGNHLFENLKTLLWAGCTFQGVEAETWQKWAVPRLMQQLREQILPDGGHYERSPMYHAHILEGCLDLLNMQYAWEELYPVLAALLISKTTKMLAWLETMTHPDGEIALFNDAAFGMAPAPHLLLDYGRKLGLTWSSPGCLTHLAVSGYVVIRDHDHYLVIDTGPLGPDYQPGHGHCDLFSFEWSVGPWRIVCDSGVYAYQDRIMRPYVRSTIAHNTVRIDGEDQSEVWKEFRVARRAQPETIGVETAADGTVRVEGKHNGYRHLTGRPIHQRQFIFRGGKLAVLDKVTGGGMHDVEAFVHFHPTITVKLVDNQMVELSLATRKIGHICCKSWQETSLLDGWYCPEFGKREPNTVLRLWSRVRLPFQGRVDIALDEEPLP